jgi:hypothetical protein
VRKITIDDTWNILEYEKIREQFRRRIIELKKKRRVGVGNAITLVFENHDTVLFHIQEMVRIERLVDDARIVQEIEVYNSLIPDSGELSATLFIELQGRDELHPALEQLVGLDQHVSLHIGDDMVIPAQFESGRAREGLISSVQYLRFPFTDEQQTAFGNGRGAVSIVIDHPNYQAQAILSVETLGELARDLERSSMVG